ncbi:MAG: ABC transporter permease subunit [Halovenus sp.]
MVTGPSTGGSRMGRRRLLASGVAGIAAFAGCIAHGEDSGLRGEIITDGSNTVLPHGAAVAEEFLWRNSQVEIPVRGSGTGAGYYYENEGVLKLVGVDNGDGCVRPTRRTVETAACQPLTRSMFVYINTAELDRRVMRAFARFYFEPIVYGFFAISFITPQIQRVFPETGTFNAAAGAIVVGIMILPMVSSLSEDAMSAVPDDLRNAGYGLGATKFEVSKNIVLPAAFLRILASLVLAISRAVGETMAVSLAAGMNPNVTLNPLEAIQTMTAYMVQVGQSDVAVGSI